MCCLSVCLSVGLSVANPAQLTADVEGREWVRSERPKPARPPSATPLSSAAAAAAPRSASSASSSAKVHNESYFARLGGANASRSADLPPSQGGKYSGFGSAPGPEAAAAAAVVGVPTLDEFSRDPVAALTKGFGFFTTQVAKSAKTVNEAVIQPTAQKIADADLARHVAVVGQKVSETGKYGFETINRFVDNAGGPTYSRVSQGGSRAGASDEHGDFWDAFGEPPVEREKHSALGTGAVKKSTVTGMAGGKKRDDWGDDDW